MTLTDRHSAAAAAATTTLPIVIDVVQHIKNSMDPPKALAPAASSAATSVADPHPPCHH
jgi:hypothetical protein